MMELLTGILALVIVWMFGCGVGMWIAITSEDEADE